MRALSFHLFQFSGDSSLDVCPTAFLFHFQWNKFRRVGPRKIIKPLSTLEKSVRLGTSNRNLAAA